MTVPTTFISVHAITSLVASNSASDAMLTLLVEGDYGTLQLSLFFSDEDPDRAKRLANAINVAMVASFKDEVHPGEQAAYEAAQYHYQGSER